MIRLAILIAAGLIIGGIIHLGSILAMPSVAERDAYSRIAEIAPVNSVTQLPPAQPGKELMPLLDPAFSYAACRYDLAKGPIKLSVPVSPSYTSVSFYTRRNVAYYAINDRSAGRRVIELYLMTEDQKAEVPEDEEITAADRLIVQAPTETGVILIKAMAPEPGLMPQARAVLNAASCVTDNSLLK